MDQQNVSAETTLQAQNFSDASNYSEPDRDIFFWQVPQLILVTSLFLLIVVGNGCVLLALIYSENGRKTRMNFFIMHLGISAFEYLNTDPDWTRILKGVVLYASTYILVSLSIDRLDAVARPMRFSRREFRAKVLVSAAWILSVLFSVPILVLFDVTSVTYNGRNITLCEPIFHHENEPKIYLTLIAIAAFIFPTIIIAVCYCVIIVVICRSSKEAKRGSCNWTFQRQESTLSDCNVESYRSNPCLGARGSHIIERAKIRTVKMTFFIVLAFILSWCPYFGFMLHHVYAMGSPNTSTLKAVTAIIQSLAPLNSAVNPIIYGVFSTRICRNLRRVPFLKHFVCCGPHARRFGSRTSHTSIVEGFYLNDISSLRRRQWSGSKWNADTDYRTSYKRSSRPLLHRDSSSLMLGQQKPERQISGSTRCSSSSIHKTDNEVDSIQSRRPGRGVPLLSRQLSGEDSELLKSFTLPKKVEHV